MTELADQVSAERVRVRQNGVLGLVLVVSLVGAFPYHLLSLFPLAAAATLRYAERRFRFAVGSVSFGLLVIGGAQALGWT